MSKYYHNLSTDPGYTWGLPPAYAEVESVARKLSLATLGTKFQPTLTLMPLGADRVIPPHAEFFEAFAGVFEVEAAAGRSEIVKVEGFVNFVGSVGAAPFLGPAFNRSSEAFELVLSALEFRATTFVTFVDCYRTFLSSERLDRLWEAFKASLMMLHLEEHPELWPDWVRELPVPLEAITFKALRSSERSMLLSGLEAFFGSPEASTELLAELISMIPAGRARSTLTHRLLPEEGLLFKGSLGYDFEPSILKDLYPEFFAGKVLAAGADPVVVEMLLESWSGDLDSLLDSAKSLSAESEVAAV